VVELPGRAKALVIGSVVRTSLLWMVPFVAVASSPWLFGAGLLDGEGALGDRIDTWGRLVATAIVVPPLLAAALCLAFPAERYGAWVARRIRRAGAEPADRTINLADELGIATGTYRYEVALVHSPIPNVAAIPGPEATTIVVTSGAEASLPRDDLAALMATQIVVASDPWVRVASTAQLLASPRFFLLFSAGFANPVLIPLAFLAFMGHRRGDAVRDMVADFAAVRATRHPEPLARALYGLRPAAPHASKLRVGLPGFLVDQYWVLSRRMTVTTSVSTPRSSRQWSTADEIAAEMAMRADRVLRASRGDLEALFDLKSWKRAVKGLGTDAASPAGLPIALTPEEHLAAQQIDAALG
jgi:Zn-dependent protease with chaperone function